MKLAILASLVLSAAAFRAPLSAPLKSSSSTKLHAEGGGALATKDDLMALAEKSNPVLKFYDPLGLSSSTIFGESQEATIAWLRHAEIKHGRVAMAAFVGYIVQANGIHWAVPQNLAGNTAQFDTLSPPEQWDALPDAAKWQIILVIGFFEWFSEAAGTHYMRGGRPGEYPNFSDHPELIPHPVPLNLYDPFKIWGKIMNDKRKARGLVSEINNGRLAMIGIFGFLAEQKVDGAVPFLKGLVKHYDGEFMVPF